MGQAADAAPCDGQPRAGHRLDQVVEELARLEHVEHHGLRTDFAGRHPEASEMVGNPRDLAHDHAHVFAALGDLEVEQILDRQREPTLLMHGDA